MTTLSNLVGTKWSGDAELWADPLGDLVNRSECTILIEADAIRYTWSYEGKTQEGSLTLRDSGADFQDTWHSQEVMACEAVPGSRALLGVQGVYSRDWGWRIGLCYRTPMDQLVLQMTNIAPWGEEARAVRMTCKRE